MPDYIAYIRVSTERQGRSGLGLEAQREAVTRHLMACNGSLLAEFVEVETGKGSNALARRPQLRAALEQAKREKAVLLIAKLDRLARNVAFIAALMEGGVDFVAADMPQANRLVLHIMAAFAEFEREAISLRTKAALAAAKARGAKLGVAGVERARLNKVEAGARLEPLAAELRALRAGGLSIRAMARDLNARSVPSPGGGRWHPTNVHRALERL